MLSTRSYAAISAVLVCLACSNAKHRPKEQVGLAGAGGVSESQGGVSNDAGAAAGQPDEVSSGGAGGNSDDVPAVEQQAGAGGAGKGEMLALPPGCPGKLEDYTMIVEGSVRDDLFEEEQLDGQVLLFGQDGDDWFAPSPPGAPDCLLGGPGDDRFETAFQSAPSTFVGGPGADEFVLRGSLDTDTAHISDFEQGHDRIVLDAISYGLYPAAGSDGPSAAQVAIVPGFAGGNSTAGATPRILYNPDDGSVWYDSDEDGTFAEAVRIAVIENFEDYQFAIEDWGLE